MQRLNDGESKAIHHVEEGGCHSPARQGIEIISPSKSLACLLNPNPNITFLFACKYAIFEMELYLADCDGVLFIEITLSIFTLKVTLCQGTLGAFHISKCVGTYGNIY